MSDLPSALCCPLCKELVRNAVSFPCCGCTVCRGCGIRSILRSKTRSCYNCGEVAEVTKLKYNKEVQDLCLEFINKSDKNPRDESNINMEVRSEEESFNHPTSESPDKVNKSVLSDRFKLAGENDEPEKLNNTSKHFSVQESSAVRDIGESPSQENSNDKIQLKTNAELEHKEELELKACKANKGSTIPVLIKRLEVQDDTRGPNKFIHSHHESAVEMPIYSETSSITEDQMTGIISCHPYIPKRGSHVGNSHNTKNLSKEQRDQIIQECVEGQVSPTDLARKWNCNADTIRNWVKKAGKVLPKTYKKQQFPDQGVGNVTNGSMTSLQSNQGIPGTFGRVPDLPTTPLAQGQVVGVATGDPHSIESSSGGSTPVLNEAGQSTLAGSTVSQGIPTGKMIAVGKLAKCKGCGFAGKDLSMCLRCSRKLPEDVKLIDDASYKSKPDSTEQQDMASGELSRIDSPSGGCTPAPYESGLSASPSGSKGPQVMKATPGKRIPGKLALCKSCGFAGKNLSICLRCRRKLPEDVELVDDASFKPKPDSTEKQGGMNKDMTTLELPRIDSPLWKDDFLKINDQGTREKLAMDSEHCDEYFEEFHSKRDEEKSVQTTMSDSFLNLLKKEHSSTSDIYSTKSFSKSTSRISSTTVSSTVQSSCQACDLSLIRLSPPSSIPLSACPSCPRLTLKCCETQSVPPGVLVTLVTEVVGLISTRGDYCNGTAVKVLSSKEISTTDKRKPCPYPCIRHIIKKRYVLATIYNHSQNMQNYTPGSFICHAQLLNGQMPPLVLPSGPLPVTISGVKMLGNKSKDLTLNIPLPPGLTVNLLLSTNDHGTDWRKKLMFTVPGSHEETTVVQLHQKVTLPLTNRTNGIIHVNDLRTIAWAYVIQPEEWVNKRSRHLTN